MPFTRCRVCKNKIGLGKPRYRLIYMDGTKPVRHNGRVRASLCARCGRAVEGSLTKAEDATPTG